MNLSRKLESWRRADARGHANQGLVLTGTYRRQSIVVELSCGGSDIVEWGRWGRELWVLSYCNRYGYVGLEVFSLDKLTPDDVCPGKFQAQLLRQVFIQDLSEAAELIGTPRGSDNPLDFEPHTIARRLNEYVEGCE